MIRNLLIISGVGLILAVVGISGAAALGGRDLAKNDWTWTVTDNEFGDGEGESFRMRRGPAEPDVTRTLAWTGGDRLQVEVPATSSTSRAPRPASSSPDPRPWPTGSGWPAAA